MDKINDEDDLDYREEKLNNISKSFIAGLLLIIAGFISVIMWIGLATIDIPFIESFILPEFQSVSNQYTLGDLTSDSIKELLIICGSIGFFLSIFTILGGIMAIKKQMWKLSMLGGILGILSIGPLFLTSILSTIGFILLIISKKEFQ